MVVIWILLSENLQYCTCFAVEADCIVVVINATSEFYGFWMEEVSKYIELAEEGKFSIF